MATSAIQLCNQALSEIGTRSNISAFDDGSKEGYQCGLWYDALRRRLLRTALWGFARGQLVMTELGDLIPDGTSPYPFLFKYAYPSDCIKMRYVLRPPVGGNISGSITPPTVGFASGSACWLGPSRENRYLPASDVDLDGNQTKVILSNVCRAIGVYTRDITNVDLFDDLFNEALQAALAYKLVIPLSGNVGQRDQFKKAAEDAILQARVADGNEAIPTSDHSVDWIVTRGVGSQFGYGPFGGPFGAGGDGWGSWFGGCDNMSWGA